MRRDFDPLIATAIIVLLLLLVWFTEEFAERKCASICSPEKSLFKWRYYSSDDCYCKRNGKWELEE